jgi:hypothetical protein
VESSCITSETRNNEYSGSECSDEEIREYFLMLGKNGSNVKSEIARGSETSSDGGKVQ